MEITWTLKTVVISVQRVGYLYFIENAYEIDRKHVSMLIVTAHGWRGHRRVLKGKFVI